MQYSLRQATGEDYDFLYRLLVTTMKDYVQATWGWEEDDQRANFASRFDPANSSIIVIDGQDAGEINLDFYENEVYLNKIYILPAYQRKGLGTRILRDLTADAFAEGRAVRLRVLKVNPARRLYERLAFVAVEETETHTVMLASPPSN